MRVAKMFMKGKSHIVEVMKVSEVKFAPGVWVLVKDLDKAWHDTEMRWVEPSAVFFMWVREFSA